MVPQGDYQVGHQNQADYPAWASEGKVGPSMLMSTPSPTLVPTPATVKRVL